MSNYPIWECYILGGGLPVAFISIIHVYIAHFSIGGGLFLVCTEYTSFKEKDIYLIRYLKNYTLYFLLLTMVFGSLTGVGIWFCISIISPSATSFLLSNFVFIWGIEWLFFIGEILTLTLYWYRFDKISQKQHIKIGIFYCIFSWLSLFAINGIISFMLTPGNWLRTSNIWDGFFNPSMLPSLGFRTFMGTMFAGIFGLLSIVLIKNKTSKIKVTRLFTKWIFISLILSSLFFIWYENVLIYYIETEKLFIGFSPEIEKSKYLLYLATFLILSLSILIYTNKIGKFQNIFALIMLFTGVLYIGSFEWYREASRRPYLISGYMYSNGIKVDNINNINSNGILNSYKWLKSNEISEKNPIKIGEEIFKLQCLSCHSIGGLNDILKHTNIYSTFGLDSQISGQGKLKKYMPPFFGTDKERMALARFIIEELNQKKIKDKNKNLTLKQTSFSISNFNERNDDYVLLGAAKYGINESQEHEDICSISLPENIIYAQLILRGETPRIVSENITIFYDIAELRGKMILAKNKSYFYTNQLTMLINSSSRIQNPYPLVKITAKDNLTGHIIAQSQIIVPISKEVGCKNCHGGGWRYYGDTAISKDTIKNIIKTHDKISGTNLFKKVLINEYIDCKSCHNNSIDGSKIMNLSTAVHGFHAVYLSKKKNESCHACHATKHTGNTRSFRGLHSRVGLGCINCHNNIENMAIGLLKNELSKGKKSAKRLLKEIKNNKFENDDSVAPRQPWINLPNCLNCHPDFNSPETDEHPYNKWTESENKLFNKQSDSSGVLCITCHGSPHALYPSINAYGKDLDNIQPLKYQNNTNTIGSEGECKICHKIDMTDGPIHHLAEYS